MKKIIAIVLVLIMALSLCACSSYSDYQVIAPHETAFVVDYEDANNQSCFDSEEAMLAAKVATKEIEIPHRKVRVGFLKWKRIPCIAVIIVDRSTQTREWSSTDGVGTSSANQAIYAESSESIGFSAGMNCSAQIYTEEDAARFLYSYNNTSLANVMDTEIRARVEAKFVEECAKYTLNEILLNKANIMQAVRDDVIPYFAEKGITITVLGMKDGLEYDDPAIQKAINEKFSSEVNLTTQENENQRVLSAAKAQAEAMLIEAQGAADAEKARADAQAYINKVISPTITEEVVKRMFYQHWDGALPQVIGEGSYIFDLP